MSQSTIFNASIVQCLESEALNFCQFVCTRLDNSHFVTANRLWIQQWTNVIKQTIIEQLNDINQSDRRWRVCKFRNAKKQNTRSKERLLPVQFCFYFDKARFSTSCEKLSFATQKGNNTKSASIPKEWRLMIPVIDQQCPFTQYLSASSNDARGLKLASSSLAAKMFELSSDVSWNQQRMNFYIKGVAHSVYSQNRQSSTKQRSESRRKTPNQPKLKRVVVIAGQ